MRRIIPRHPSDHCPPAPVALMAAAMLGAALLAWPAWAESSPLDRRQQLIQAFDQQGIDALPQITLALQDEAASVRRTAAHLLVRLGEPAAAVFPDALTHKDMLVRRVMIDGLAEMGLIGRYWHIILLDDHPAIRRDVRLIHLEDHPVAGGEQVEQLAQQLMDQYQQAGASRRLHVLETLNQLDVPGHLVADLLVSASRDTDESIRQAALTGLLKHMQPDWPQASRADGAMGIVTAALGDDSPAVVQLGRQLRWKLLEAGRVDWPKTGWRFTTDPQGVGRSQAWFAVDYDDSHWQHDAVIEASWNTFLNEPYVGDAWYRHTIHVPEDVAWDEADLQFQGVDEAAWVWVNGQFVGEHDIGAAGWDVEFVLDVSRVLRPGGNQVTVMARNTRGEGGIWRPVRLRLLDTSRLPSGTANTVGR